MNNLKLLLAISISITLLISSCKQVNQIDPYPGEIIYNSDFSSYTLEALEDFYNDGYTVVTGKT